ncbi:MAG: thrombospondin type 3 repeat-containing protein, partial [Caldilineaceae bacterium]|nr:thrombospondin type 3 repeat-containing protein [Caldilineaceae bacterium]
QIRALGLEKSWRLFYGILRNNRLNANSGFLAMRNAAVAEALSLAQQGIFTDKGKDNDLCQVRNAYAAVEIGQGDANCDGIEDEVANGADDDHDGIFNQFDNCPAVWNPGQSYQPWTDQDNDKIGDACDQDRDGDTICDEGGPFSNVNRPPGSNCVPGQGTKNQLPADNCLSVPNADQADFNNNGIGDRCDDSDGDGRVDADDNCPSIRQVTATDWRDTDGDHKGDLCDDDDDNDGQADALDNCPLIRNYGDFGNGEDTTETDRGLPADNVGDACDLCPFVSSPDNTESDYPPDGFANPCDQDDDNDAICDQGGPLAGGVDGIPAEGCKPGRGTVGPLNPQPADNCPHTYNPDQLDSDHNGLGYACDALEQIRLTHELNQFIKEFVLVADDVTRLPLPICPDCVAQALPQRFESVVKLQIPDGFTAQVSDDRGNVVARSIPTASGQTIRFQPAPYAITKIGAPQAASIVGSAGESLAADSMAYYLEFIPLSPHPAGDTVTVTVALEEKAAATTIYLPFVSR